MLIHYEILFYRVKNFFLHNVSNNCNHVNPMGQVVLGFRHNQKAFACNFENIFSCILVIININAVIVKITSENHT